MASQSIKERLIFSQSALEIVTNPFIVGDELLHLAKESSKDFFRCLNMDKMKAPFACLNILRGGRYYSLIDAWNETMMEAEDKNKHKLALSEVRASRECDQNGNWVAKIWHDKKISNISSQQSEDNLLNASTVIIGDTIATGTTLINILKWFVELRKKNNVKKEVKIIIFSICGSSNAKYKLYPLYQDVLKVNGIEIELVLANAAYTLNNVNGTDLSLITDEILPNAQKYIVDKVGAEFMINMKCAIWDWGERFNGIPHHLKEITEYFSSFYLFDLPPYIRKALTKQPKNEKIVFNKLSG